MALNPGTRIGSYEIAVLIGVGGMGEVYRATDTKLGREVAIKVLPEALASVAERLARFDREAKTLAALNHPNIAAIYGLEDADGFQALVMELVEGPTLADRIAQGRFSADEALPVAKQIADALEAAHERGIVHRDLKPANIKITPDGRIKVLDFGLAKALIEDDAETDLSNSPTRSAEATRQGVILGTAGYMSPEQAKGQRVDRRTDIWAFGCVLFEMLTGRALFPGESVSEILAAVLRETPNWDAVPRRFRKLLRACLERDPERRLRHIGDMQLLLEDSGDETASQSIAARRPSWVWPAVAAAALVATVLVVVRQPADRDQPDVALRFLVDQPADIQLTDLFSVSPDGRQLAILGTTDGARYLIIHTLGTDSFQPLSATRTKNTLDLNGFPIWSPDSRSVAYWRDGALMHIDVDSGTEAEFVPVPEPLISGFWIEGRIVFGTSDYRGLWLLTTSDGSLTQLTNGPDIHPSPLPGGRDFLYVSDPYRNGLSGHGYDPGENGLSSCLDEDEAPPVVDGGGRFPTRLFVGSLDATGCEQRMREIASDFYAAAYVESARGSSDRYLLLLREGNLSVQRFDPATLQRVGDPQPLVTGIARRDLPSGDDRGFVFPTPGFAVTADRLVFRSVNPLALTWFDLGGNPVGTDDESALYAAAMALSGDGERVAAVQGSDGEYDIWVHSPSGAEDAIPLVTEPRGQFAPVFSADGQTVAYTANLDVYARRADGTGEAKSLYSAEGADRPTGFSPDGRYLLFRHAGGDGADIWLLSLDTDGNPTGARPLIVTAENEGAAEFSSNAEMIAYQSNRGDQARILVQAFDPDSSSPAIPVGTGTTPHWSANEGELFYMRPDRFIMRVQVDMGPDGNPKPGTPQALFEAPATPGWDVHPDGDRFIMAVPREGPAPLTAVLDWMADLADSR